MFAWLAVASALAMGPSAPQDDPNTDPVAQLPSVMVDGRPLAEQARSFVAAATEGPRHRSLARWETPICFGVANLKADAAQALIDRMAKVAVSLGVETQAPGCKPNLLVIAAHAADAEAVVRRAIDRSEFDFRPARGGTDRGRAALEAFASSTAPVRWWHVSLPVEVRTGGPALLLDGEGLMGPAFGAPGAFGEAAPVLTVRVDSLSRTRSTVRNDLMRVIIVVDADQAAAVPFPALADYIAMVGLAQIDPEAEVGDAPTILNLFNADASQPTRRMTDWDAAFLISLYEARSNPASLNHQEHDIGRRLARVLQSGESAAD
ncbi:hypothetical protein [Brevundimonas sp.]|uniref:hypothetical protein n=1 Tax=Brevundimonas sp. TaxID=1871086 RepID=UPI002BF948C9|nr:hypothetical protein [Brevundimonas sp.]HWQ85280.1 hypothetical protein [Brevundimonas sp.]